MDEQKEDRKTEQPDEPGNRDDVEEHLRRREMRPPGLGLDDHPRRNFLDDHCRGRFYSVSDSVFPGRLR